MLLSEIENDQIRILTTLVRELHTSKLCPDLCCHFTNNKKPQIGDIVICNTSGIHDYTVGVVVELIDSNSCKIRKFGSEDTCNVVNESFDVLVIPKDREYLFWEGLKYEFAVKIQKVVYKYGDGWKKLSHIVYVDDKYADVHIREHVFAGTTDITVPLRVKWNRKTVSQKQLWEEIQSDYYAAIFVKPTTSQSRLIDQPVNFTNY